MLACAKTLGLASEVFRKMLQGSFREGATLKSTGNVRIPLPDDDPQALTILLDIVHHRPRRVPRTVAQGVLVQLARLIDKYCLHEAVELFSPQWIDSFVPIRDRTYYYAELMAIYCCFGRRTEFKTITHEVTRMSSKCFDAAGLPIPAEYISKSSQSLTLFLAIIGLLSEGAIDAKRWLFITEIFRRLSDLRGKYLGTSVFCRYECDCAQLGAFMKELGRLGLMQQPAPPYDTYTLAGLIKDLRTVKTPRYECSTKYLAPSHIQNQVQGILDDIEKRITGIDLKVTSAPT